MKHMLTVFAIVCQVIYSVPVEAGGCRAVTQYQVAAPVYAVQKTVYTPTYNLYGITAVEQPVYSVYVVGQEARQKQRGKDIEARLLSLEETAKTTDSSIRALLQLQYNSMQGAHGSGANLPNGVASGLSSPVQVNQTDQLVIPVLQKHCAKCHTGEGHQGGFKLFETGGAPAVFTPEVKFLVESVINDNSMPPEKHERVPDKDYQSVRKWYEEDPAVRAAIRAMAKGKKQPSNIPPDPPKENQQ